MNTLPLPASHIYLIAALLLIVPASCTSQSTKDKKTTSAFLQTYGGDPYMGTVQVDVIQPNGSIKTKGYGEGSAHFADSGSGKAQMVVFGAIDDKKGDAGFAVTGAYTEKTWKSTPDSVSLEIQPNGAITGGGTSGRQQFQFTGTISDIRIDLETRVKMLQPPAGGYPDGTTFVFRYHLRRDRKGQPNTSKKCDRIVWQTQYVAGFDGSATTVRIPRCVSK